MSIIIPEIDPIIFNIGPIAIRWYPLAYIFGILLGIQYIKWLVIKTKSSLKPSLYDEALAWIILGIVVGGRLGYVIFYDFTFFINNPINILKTWNGGMSFHGGLIGFIISIYLYCLKNRIEVLAFLDFLACAAPIGLFLGRIANFINGELYGRITDVSWGVVFKYGGPYPRHPSQLYEALGEGFLAFIILNILVLKTNISSYPGKLSGTFLLIYSIARIVVENFREPDTHIGFLIHSFTMGQLLTLPMIIVGVILVTNSSKNQRQ